VTVASGPWRNRIVGEGEEDPTSLLANPKNWRTHPGRQRDALRGSLGVVGWVQRIIVNRTTGHVVDGHARIEEAISAGAPNVPVLYVELTAEEEDLVLASLDPIGAMAGTDQAKLVELLGDVAVDEAGLSHLLDSLRPPDGDAYTAAIEVPRYEPTGAMPAIETLFDETRTEALRNRILDANVPKEIEDFLFAAAGRHTVFDYGRIAAFYAHAEPEVQRLFEDSALVIVDFENAIRDGYVRFMGAIEELEAEDRDAY
jgi:hypothetical protein